MRTIEEIEALLLLMGKEMFYTQQPKSKMWWAMVDTHKLIKTTGGYTDTTPLYTTIEPNQEYFGIYPTKEEALNYALDRYINDNGETK